ncbi:MAG: radical SAM protein, partial [Thermoguttaceae bacterium]
MAAQSLGFCSECRGRVPAEYRIHDQKVWFAKFCPDCGTTQSLISSDPPAWQAKRDLWQGVPARQAVPCTLHCDRCTVDHAPAMLFMDVTNRCNMDCPMCGFSLRRMGFEFNPPLDYFEKIYRTVAQMHPRPIVNLFGGEPTVRDDMFEIIELGRSLGVDSQITTNGLRLADEDYCRRICEANVGLRLAFDGRGREIYERLRNNGPAYEKKLRALENLKKYSRRKHTIIACMASGINDQYMADLIQFCHDYRQVVSELGIIPLYENWQEGEFDVAVHTTAEDVERMVRDSVPGEGVEFIPAGITHWLAVIRRFFSKKDDLGLLKFAGVHPNCESIAFLIADGGVYRGLNHYIHKPLQQTAKELAGLVEAIE